GPAVRVRQAHRRRVPAVRGGPVRPGGRRRRPADRRAARGVRAGELEGRAGGGIQPWDAPEADHLERVDPSARVHRGGRAHGGARPQSSAPAEGHLPPVREPRRHRAHEHPHARGRRGDVRPRRHHPTRQDRGRGDGGRPAAATPRLRRQPGGAVPEADGGRPGARVGAGAGQRRGRRGSMTQPSLWRVFEPKWRTALQRIREERSRGGSGKLLLLVGVGTLFWLAVFRVLYVILRYFRGVEELGPLLAGKLLGLVLLSFISILVLSNVITALSSFFLAKDLDLLVSAPVDWLRIYLAKLGETLLHSSWMVALMAVPILTAYGVSYHGGPLLERFVRGEWWRWTFGTLLGFLPVAKREFVLKDVKLFFRDTTQWSQLILLAVLVVVYLFNIKALPLHRGEQVGFFYVTLVSFLNLGLAGFVLAAIAARFIFPAVS